MGQNLTCSQDRGEDPIFLHTSPDWNIELSGHFMYFNLRDSTNTFSKSLPDNPLAHKQIVNFGFRLTPHTYDYIFPGVSFKYTTGLLLEKLLYRFLWSPQ